MAEDWREDKASIAIGMLGGSQYGFAGLWENWKKENGTLLETFTIITTDPNEITEPLHDRMLVTMEPRDYECWLQPAVAEALPIYLLRPFLLRRCGHRRRTRVSAMCGMMRKAYSSVTTRLPSGDNKSQPLRPCYDADMLMP